MFGWMSEWVNEWMSEWYHSEWMIEDMVGWLSEFETCECKNKLGYVIKHISYFYMRIWYSTIGYVTVDMPQ